MITAPTAIDDTVSALRSMAGGYDAVDDRGRRRPPRTQLATEDHHLPAAGRRKLTATTRDVRRNYAIAAWAIRKHLDYVSSFRFQAKTGDPELNARIETFMRGWSHPRNCDVAGRHSLRRMIRLGEACATVDGDVFFLKLSSKRLQAIEGDRIKTPTTGLPPGVDPSRFTHGVETTAAGRPQRFAVCDRGRQGNRLEFRSLIPARHMIHRAYFDRFDQVRGVSPLAAALNTLQDTYEAFDYALAKAKISQLFGMKFTRNSDHELPGPNGDGPEGSGEFADREPYKVDFGRGPVVLDMDPGDDAAFLESATPATQFQEFTQTMIGVALKALDIPFSFYDEAYTNFFGSKAALNQYLKSANHKREDNRAILHEITDWRLGLAILDDELELPAGMTVDDIRYAWVPDGIAWWDRSKEVPGDVMAVAAGFSTRSDILAERTGRDFRDVIDELAEEEAYIKSKGVNIVAAGKDVFNPPAVVQRGEGDDAD